MKKTRRLLKFQAPGPQPSANSCKLRLLDSTPILDQDLRLRLLEAALQSVPTAVMITDSAGLIYWVNNAFVTLTGYTPGEVIGKAPSILRSSAQLPWIYDHMREVINRGGVWHGEVRNRRKDGIEYEEEQTITPIRNASGAITHFVAIKADVTQRNFIHRHLASALVTDPLTGLANRLSLERRLDDLTAIMTPQDQGYLLVADMDGFLHINEGFGHDLGDQLLLKSAQILQRVAGDGAMVARLGDDEFGLLLRGVNEQGARQWAHQVIHALAEVHVGPPSKRVSPTVSVGLAPLVAGRGAKETLQVAAQAVSMAKEAGGNRAEIVERPSQITDAASSLAAWGARIRSAVRGSEFQLQFQPVVRLASRRVEHYEVLLRLPDASGELLSPVHFLPAAERLHLMPLIDRWVFDAAYQLLWRNPALKLFINLSGQTLEDSDFLQHVMQVVSDAPSLAERLTFEITETTAVRNLLRAKSWMAALRAVGCHFALDDFGIGFSSLAYLRELPVDCLKIDGSFVLGLDSDATNQIMVRSVVSIAHAMGKTVVAEWVETPAVARLLDEMGVDLGQGFALGHPGPLPAGV